jgi:hypothetical protein
MREGERGGERKGDPGKGKKKHHEKKPHARNQPLSICQ